MNERTSTFQLLLMIAAGALAVVGVVTFAFFRSQGSQKGVPITVWGPFPQASVDAALLELQAEGLTGGNITYVEKLPEALDSQLVEAIADNAAPDVVILEASQIYEHAKRIIPVPYETLPRRTLEESFAGADAFAGAGGVLAVPLLIDPLVLYANTSRLASAGIASTPGYWDQVLAMTPQLTELGASRAIARSAVALGEYANVAHAKEIFFALANQTGAAVFGRDVETPADGEPEDVYRVELSGRQGAAAPPATAALLFYSQFADASKEVYTWNRSLPVSTDRFLSGDLALYLGFGSERAKLAESNPNLPYAIAPLPQSRAASARSTFGRFYAAALVRTTKSPADAFAAAWALSSESAAEALARVTGMAPARRALLDAPDASRTDEGVVYSSAVMARPMLTPNPEQTGEVISRMMGNVSSGRLPADEAIALAQQELELLFGAGLEAGAPSATIPTLKR
jgi:hypothetical protein